MVISMKNYKKRIFALALSAVMVFSPMDYDTALAAEVENQEVESQETENQETESQETENQETENESELESVLETAAGETDTAGSFAEETGAADDSALTAEENGTDAGSGETQAVTGEEEEIQNTALTETETETETESSAEEETLEDETLLSDDEEVEKGLKISGTCHDITWKLYKDGHLVITGTGDYVDRFTREPGWLKSQATADTIVTAEVNISGITSTEGMFTKCRSLVSVDLTNLDTSQVTNMASMFAGCEKLTNLDVSHLDTRKVTNIANMFGQCSSLTNLDVSHFNTSNVTNMSSMFNYCDSLTSLDVSHFNTGNVTSMANMFYSCKSLTSLDVSHFNTSNVTSMAAMFCACESLASLDVSHFDTSKVTKITHMFSRCRSLASLDVSRLDTSNVTDMTGMFSYCESLTSLDVSRLDTSKVKDMTSMFLGCKSLTSLDVSSLNTSKAIIMAQMFEDCESLASLNVSGLDTSNAAYMSAMFKNCSSLTSLDVSGFDTSNVTDMMKMFRGCSSLVSLDVSGFNTKKVKSMQEMFYGCSSLTSLDVSNFETHSLDNVIMMFGNCTSLVSVDLGGFDMMYVKTVESTVIIGSDMFIMCKNLTYLHAPVNLSQDVKLPKAEGTDKWYTEDGTECTQLPKNLTNSIWLYKNGYPGNGTMKQLAVCSGIAIENKVYDGTPNPYTGTVAVTDAAGTAIDAPISHSYTGTLADGSAYAETTQAPSQAGSYTLSFAITGDAADQYNLQKSVYNFSIMPKTVTITAPSVSIELNGHIPTIDELSALFDVTSMVNGFLEGDSLLVNPMFRYSAANIEDIPVSTAGRYSIIPYGAGAGSNYSISYANGTLTIGNPDSGSSGNPGSSEDPGDDSPFDEKDRVDLKSAGGAVADIRPKTYDGLPYEPAVKVTVLENGKPKTLTEGTDYRVIYENHVNAGTDTGCVTVKGNGIYKGELTKAFTINPKQIKTLKIIGGNMAAGDTASAPPIYIYDGAALLQAGKDYTLPSTAGLTAKAAKAVPVTIKGTGNYTGEATAKIAVYDAADASKIINAGDVTLKSTKVLYTGKAVKDNVAAVKVNGTPLAINKDYKVQYQNNINAGTAFAIITGKGQYKGKAVVSFEIASDTAQNLTVNPIKAKLVYNGRLQRPKVKVTAGKKTLKLNKDYTIAYKNNLHAGEGTVTVTGTGNYSGTATQTFTINQQKISKVSVKGTRSKGLQIAYGSRLLKEGKDYTLEYDETSLKNNKIKVTIKAVAGGDFMESVAKTVKTE